MKISFEFDDHETKAALARYSFYRKTFFKVEPRTLEDIALRAFKFYIDWKIKVYLERSARKAANVILSKRLRLLPNHLIRCEYCPTMLTRKTMTVDHDHPVARGGKIKDLTNLVACCSPCNNLKGMLTGAEFKWLLKTGFYEKKARNRNIYNAD